MTDLISGSGLTFKPVDLDSHRDDCVRFSMDACLCSLGSAQPFIECAGEHAVKYIDWLREMSITWPGSMVHVLNGDRLVGQIEMTRLTDDPAVGYVHLFYLLPELRGRGLGAQLVGYALRFAGAHGCHSLRLSVHPDNTPACRFYRRDGWQDLGRRVGASGTHLLQKAINPVHSKGEPL